MKKKSDAYSSHFIGFFLWSMVVMSYRISLIIRPVQSTAFKFSQSLFLYLIISVFLSVPQHIMLLTSDLRIRAPRIRIHLFWLELCFLGLNPNPNPAPKTLNPDSNPNPDSDSHITAFDMLMALAPSLNLQKFGVYLYI